MHVLVTVDEVGGSAEQVFETSELTVDFGFEGTTGDSSCYVGRQQPIAQLHPRRPWRFREIEVQTD